MIRLATISAAGLGLACGAALAQAEEFSASGAKLEGNELSLKITSPQAGWVVVHKVDAEGKPGAHIGHVQIQADETADVMMTLSEPVEGNELIVVLHEDLGTEGTFEFGPDDKTDAPVMQDGAPVQAKVSVTP